MANTVISLRKLAKVRNRLEEVMKRAYNDARGVVMNVEVTDANLDTKIASNHDTVLSSIEAYKVLTVLRKDLRQLVAENNATAGVSRLMTEAARLTQVIALYEQLLSYDDASYHRYADADLLNIVNTRKALLQTNESFNSTTIRVGLLSADEYKNIRGLCEVAKSDLSDLTDQIEALNATTKVELQESIVSQLNAVGIRV